MTILDRIYREPAAALGFVTAALGIATLYGLNPEIAGALVTSAGAAVALLRYVVTPAREVVAQELPSGEVIAGAASDVLTGHPVAVDVVPADTPLAPPRRHRDRGASDAVTLLVAVVLVVVALVLLRVLG